MSDVGPPRRAADWGLRERVSGFMRLARPGNALAAGVLTFTGGFVEAGALAVETARQGLLLAVIATALAVGAGNAINDYFDREIDSVNRPERPIPSGRVSPRGAAVFALLLGGAAIGAVLPLPVPAVVLAAVNLFVLLAYTELFKGYPAVGNLVVAYLTGSTFLFGAFAVRGVAISGDVGVLAALAGIATLAREILKDVEDMAGDRAEGLRTLPLVIGERPALTIAIAVMALGVTASGLPYFWGTFGVAYLLLVIPADFVMLTATVWSVRDAGAAQRWLKLGMFLAAGAFLLARAVSL